MGLLSMLPSEDTDKPTFGWWERRFPILRTNTGASGAAVFALQGGGALTDSGTGVTMTKDVVYRVTVLDTSQFKATHVIQLRNVQNQTGAVTPDMTGTVTAIIDATHLEFRPYSTYTGVKNGTADAAPNNYGLTVPIIGTANQEGAQSGPGVIQYPVNPLNLTQIFRSAFMITRTQLKTGLLFDKSGPYKLMAWENGLRHMVEMEKAFIFGQNESVLVTDPQTGDVTPETKTGGCIWFLQQWEAANSFYRGGTGAPAVTSNLDDNKRIIDFGGVLTKNDTAAMPGFNTCMARLFRKTNDKAYEKLCLCGGTLLQVVNSMFERELTRTVAMIDKERDIEFIVHSIVTLRGTIHFRVHPLFDEDPDLQGAGLFLDLGNLKYRYLTDSDTVFLKDRQARDRDSRKDEWISECGLELRFPESCMYWKNVLALG
jgi:hypothetical protein